MLRLRENELITKWVRYRIFMCKLKSTPKFAVLPSSDIFHHSLVQICFQDNLTPKITYSVV